MMASQKQFLNRGSRPDNTLSQAAAAAEKNREMTAFPVCWQRDAKP
jgi:hypothetical protein